MKHLSMRLILLVTGLGHLLNHSLTLVYPVIIVQLSKVYPSTTLTTFGLLGTIHYFLYGLGALPAGWLADRFGTRNLLLVYFLGAAGSTVILALSQTMLQLAWGLGLLGLFCSLYHPSGLTLISHTSKQISKHLGFHGIAGSLGLTLGPLLGGVLASLFDWYIPFLVFGALALMVGLFLWFLSKPEDMDTVNKHDDAARPTRYRPLVYSYLIGIFMGLAHRGGLSFLPLHFSTKVQGSIDPVIVGGILTALVLAAGIVGQTLGGWWGDRASRGKILWIIVLLNLPPLAMMSYTKGWILIAVALAWGVTNFVYQPVANALIADFSNPRKRGMFFGIMNGVSFGVGSVAATLAGAVGDTWGTEIIFIVMALILIPAVILGLFLRRETTLISVASQ